MCVPMLTREAVLQVIVASKNCNIAKFLTGSAFVSDDQWMNMCTVLTGTCRHTLFYRNIAPDLEENKIYIVFQHGLEWKFCYSYDTLRSEFYESLLSEVDVRVPESLRKQADRYSCTANEFIVQLPREGQAGKCSHETNSVCALRAVG